MRPSPNKVKNIADYKLYFTDHETLHADPRNNDMVFVPKKTQVKENRIMNTKATYKVPDMMIPPSNKYRENFLALAAKSKKPFNISNPSNYMLFQKMHALEKVKQVEKRLNSMHKKTNPQMHNKTDRELKSISLHNRIS